MTLGNVRNIVLVLSGKGGVGKSSITTQLALSLSLQGNSVGVLDVDLTGPSIPRFFGVENSKVRQGQGGRMIPVVVHEAKNTTDNSESVESVVAWGQLTCMSLGFVLASRSDAVIWRGPKKTAMVRQFLTDVLWPENLDYLLIDTPPGTSDEHISLLETLLKSETRDKIRGAVVVTTPQAISVADVKKELNFCSRVGLRVLGVVENMAGFVCPNCKECTDIFSKKGGEVMASEFGVPFLGRVPIDPAFVMMIEEGTVPRYPEGTIIEQEDVGRANGALDARESAALLIEKYQFCSLFPIFRQISSDLTVQI